MTTKPGRTRRRRFGLVAGLVPALLVAVALGSGPAQAADDGNTSKPAVTKRGEAYMGWSSQDRRPAGERSPGASANRQETVAGMDVSGHQGNVDWPTAYGNGARFAYVKATEGNYYQNDYFTQQYNGSYDVGMIRGAYHFATPNDASGAEQANYFVDHGGGWSKDGKTLPGALDIEFNPYGDTCYGLSQGDMVAWIADFLNTYRERTGRYATIYTNYNWWVQCTGNAGDFGANHPLWIARYSDSPGDLPAGWSFHTIWQYSDSGTFPGDQNQFNGAYDRLQALANGE